MSIVCHLEHEGGQSGEIHNQSTPSHVNWPSKRLGRGSLRSQRIGARREMGQSEACNVGCGCVLVSLPRTAEVLRFPGRNPVDVRRFSHKQVGAGCQASDVGARPTVTRVHDSLTARREAQAGIRHRVGQWAALDAEGPNWKLSPARNSRREYPSDSIPGRSSASTASSAPGSAYTGSGAAITSPRTRARNSGFRSAQ